MAKHRSSAVRQFKGETVYDWESEPAEERPTGFGASTTFSHSTLSSTGFHSTSSYNSTLEARRRIARYKRRGSIPVWLMGVFVFAAITAGVAMIGRFLKG